MLRLGVLLVVSCAATVACAQGFTPRLVVMAPVLTDVPASLLQPMNEYMLSEFQSAKRYEVLGGSDVTAMLQTEVQKQLAGCDDDDCLAQIAGALNAEYMAYSSIGRVGEGYLFSVRIIKTRDTVVVGRASVKSGASDDQLLAAIRTGVRMVTATSGFADEWPQVTALPLGLWSGAVASLGAGIAFGLKAQAHYHDFQDPTYVDVAGARRAGRTSQTVANVAFGTSVVAAAVGTLVWWLTGERVQVVTDTPESPVAAW